MIEIKKADNQFKTENNINYEAYVCFDKEDVLGLVEYKIEENDLILTKIDCDENLLADGIVRQTLNNALDNGCETCKFNEEVKNRLFDIRIIKNKDQNSIDILDFFMKINHI
ncbi:MAG: hypothetical protein IIU65_02845 [Clostridia bacterium]|nr:hypothetical protein [Clostridia bacterium]MBQ5884697.1 hypothetical protein [Clostridia bacterium]